MLNRPRTGIVVFIIFQGLAAAGCGEHGMPTSAPITAPSVVSRTVPAPPPGHTAFGGVAGFVLDTAFRTLPGASVEALVDSAAAPSTTTDSQGHFTLTGQFDATTVFRATSDNHVAATDALHLSSPGGQPWILFWLAPIAPPANIAGDYSLTLVADTTCSDLPDEIRFRTYSAAITLAPTPNIPADTHFKVTVNGIAPDVRQSFSDIGVAGRDLGFDMSGNDDGAPTLVERVAPNAYLSYLPYEGFAGTSVDASVSGFSTNFDGTIDYSAPAGHVRCRSTNHRMTMVRR